MLYETGIAGSEKRGGMLRTTGWKMEGAKGEGGTGDKGVGGKRWLSL